MLDAYIWGKVTRISPEAPVPVLDIVKREARPGGAANVALNVAALDAQATIYGVTGNDDHANTFRSLMEAHGIATTGLVADAKRNTTVKTRIIAQGQQMLRVDDENKTPISDEVANTLLQQLEKDIQAKKVDAIILEDYNKGLLTPYLIQAIIALGRKHIIPVTVDPKLDNFFAYEGAHLFKPNLKELAGGLKTNIDASSEASVEDALEALCAQMNINTAMVTLSEYGVQCKAEDFTGRIAAHRREIADVSGAGDTVIAVATVCLAAKLPSLVMCELANLAGGLVCEEVGVVPISKEKLLEEAIEVLHGKA